MATMVIGTLTSSYPAAVSSPPPLRRRAAAAAAAAKRAGERSLEETYGVRVERGASRERLAELGVERWSRWRTGRCRLAWDWHVDQLVYVVSGEVRVVPDGAASRLRHMRFVAGDLVRYPKWFEADLFFDGPYEELYQFRAHGDDDA
uniref:(S)-ureidoglycine aminohydrolase cupin domain-containing protein n=1 Tax=Ananas comosus var. bracteatus TaxID=296719 RepID=A0A6V7QXR0_ANACO